MKSIGWLIAGLFLLGVTLSDIRRGSTVDHAWRFDRDETPFLFWFQITTTILCALFCLVIALLNAIGIPF